LYGEENFQAISKIEKSYFSNGKSKYFYPNGKVCFEYDYVNNQINGIYKSYFNDGSPKEIINYLGGKKNGCSILFDNDGSCKNAYFYQNNEIVKNNDPLCNCTNYIKPINNSTKGNLQNQTTNSEILKNDKKEPEDRKVLEYRAYVESKKLEISGFFENLTESSENIMLYSKNSDNLLIGIAFKPDFDGYKSDRDLFMNTIGKNLKSRNFRYENYKRNQIKKSNFKYIELLSIRDQTEEYLMVTYNLLNFDPSKGEIKGSNPNIFIERMMPSSSSSFKKINNRQKINDVVEKILKDLNVPSN
jgi:antitoxin component YwqK of YwqJK toxin-antitoxin module